MQIYLHEPREWPTPSGAMQQFPAGWTGDAPDAAAQQWIAEGVAERTVAPRIGGALTPDQTAILAAAADEIAAQRKALAEAAGEHAGKVDPDEEIDLTTMSDDELRQVAEDLGIKAGRKSRTKLIAEIETKVDEINAADAAAAGDEGEAA